MRFFGGESFRAAFALFHDVFVELRIDRQGIVPGETRQTKLVRWFAGGSNHPINVKVSEAVDPEILADFGERHLIRDQLFRIGKIDSVMAGETMRWTTY